jgi:hypothetical protein
MSVIDYFPSASQSHNRHALPMTNSRPKISPTISPFLFDVSVIDLALAQLLAFLICYADDTTTLVVAAEDICL